MRGIWFALIVSSVIGCGEDGGKIGLGAGGDFGATPGGVKDLRLARDLVEAGKVPPAAALLVEAMFAEHDLGLTGAPCPRTLCVRGAAGFAPELDGTAAGWAQVGLSSTIDPSTWVRPSTTFIFTVDVSGSMAWGESRGTTPGELSRRLLHQLTDALGANDRVAIVTYGDSVNVPLALTTGTSQSLIHSKIDALSEAGSTNMEAGMHKAYQLGQAALGTTEQVRVIVFTDTQPNVGATGPSEFQTIVDAAAGDGIHTTTLAFGTGVGPEVLRAMASLRGANAYSLMDLEQVDTFMADDYPWFTTPIAFDLRVNLSLGGWGISRGLGFPAGSDEEEQGLKASTVFLSKRKGALLVALTSPDGTPANLGGSFTLSYREPDGTDVADTAAFGYDGTPLDTRGHWFQQHSTGRTVALGLLTEGMHDAATKYATDPEGAEAIMRTAHERFTADAQALADADLAVEVAFSKALLDLIIERAPQGTLYGP